MKNIFRLWQLRFWSALSLWAQRQHFEVLRIAIESAHFELEAARTDCYDLGAEEGTPKVENSPSNSSNSLHLH
jgi:hypothetical protein